MDQVKQITHSTPPQWIGNEYSSMSPFNCDNTRLLLVKVDHFGLYDGNGAFLSDLSVPASAEPRWSRQNPDIVLYLSGNVLLRHDVRLGGQDVPLHTFTEYTKISGHGESDISPDGDHFVFGGIRPDGIEEVFVYQISTGTKLAVQPQSKSFDGLKIDSQNYAILSRPDGIWRLEATPRKIAPSNGHACPAVHNGKPVLLWCSSNDPQANSNSVMMIDLETGVMDILHTFDWKYAFHISSCDLAFCVVSLDCPTRDLPSQCWKLFHDKRPAELICDTDSIYLGYNSQVKAALSRDGSKLVGCSNFGKTDDPNYCDCFLVNLTTSTPTPPPNQTRINYSSYVGKTAWVQVPRSDGALDEIEITWADWLKIKGTS